MANENGGDGDSDKQLKTCAVLGGRGFVGSVLVEMLLRIGNWIVRVADTAKTPELKPSESVLADALASGRAAYFQVDVRHTSQIIQAVEGVSVVFYFDSMDSFPPDFYFCYNIIVQGAKNVINACRECNVKHLIYNSSADVVFDDGHDIHNGDESLPYSGRVWDMVTDLKTQAEALILFANDIGGVLTCALRPCNVFGPGDKQLLPLLVNMAKSTWVKFIIGSGKNLSDFTYVDNVAHAHICAEESLSSQKGSVSGKVFFITNLEPMEFWEFASLLLEGLGYQRPVTSLPAWATHFVVLIIKLLHMKSDTRKLDPFVSVYNVASLALRTRTFSCSAAEKHIRYSPIVSMEEAVESTVDSYSHLAVDSPFMICKDSNEPSKVEKLLGSGKVADLLLWRDEKKTFLCFFFLAFLYHWFFLSGRTFISSVAKLLLLIIVLLCGHYILPLTGYESSIPRIPSSCFEISEVDMRNSFFTIRCMWNKLDSLTKSLAQGEDWCTFLKASIFLYFFKLIVPPHFTVAVGLGLILSFSLCFVYEQYEERIDVIASVVLTVAERVLMLFVRKLPMSSSSVSFDCKPLVENESSQHLLLDSRQ
ncbi:3beta-hydroxysteroid-dehydrogenase/decarboxylase isoform X1 [Sesamum indicum]|uniref:Reticulon-like protein n=1 Tax=Sesamum indicum TaxID=4182 RepID=A0A6I9TZ86_SESIN|nr:3beta-hydroxysteroid-dehydrogenase/decarboxylase isoform X1 [Sesamum indicum]